MASLNAVLVRLGSRRSVVRATAAVLSKLPHRYHEALDLKHLWSNGREGKRIELQWASRFSRLFMSVSKYGWRYEYFSYGSLVACEEYLGIYDPIPEDFFKCMDLLIRELEKYS